MSVSRHRDDDEASEETGKEGVGRSYMGREGGSVGWGSEVDKERERVRLPPLRSSGTFMSDWRPGIQCAVPERPLPAACPALCLESLLLLSWASGRCCYPSSWCL